MSEKLKQFTNEYPLVIEIPVQWGEMDAFNHVNNAVYFKYFESARIAYMEKTGVMSEMKSKMIGPILASTECRYRRPVTFPDTLKIGCKIIELKDNEFTQEYAVFSIAQDTIATKGKGRIVMVNYKSHQKTEISDSIIAAIREFQPELN
ncbi:MAG: acyl-CoA thioesterase [Gammaproteobacteria bacterium]|nr:acyl-CoA thioesterase [Gammaproteobacteria bacterium]